MPSRAAAAARSPSRLPQGEGDRLFFGAGGRPPRDLGERTGEVDHVPERGPADGVLARGGGGRARWPSRRTGWRPAPGSSAARARSRARSGRGARACDVLREPEPLAAHLARVALRGRPRPGAGCRRGGGGGAGSPPGRRRGGRTGPPGTPWPPPGPSGRGWWPPPRARRRSGSARPPRARTASPARGAGSCPAAAGGGRRSRRGRACRGGRAPPCPTLRPVAPVNAPFSWPKSSFSSRASGMAAQLMATKGPLARAESWWRARLISSLPVPLSPRMSTVASVAAARWIASIVSLRAGSSPRTLGRPKRRW